MMQSEPSEELKVLTLKEKLGTSNVYIYYTSTLSLSISFSFLYI